MKHNNSVAEILRLGFEAVKKNSNIVLPLFVGLQVGVFLLTYLLQAPFFNILMIPVVIFMQIAIFKSFNAPYKKFDFNEIFSLYDPNIKSKFWKLLITYLIYIVLLILLFVLLVVPGIIFMIYWYFFPYIVLDHNLSGMAALKKSKEMLLGHWWKTFAIFIITLVCSLAESVILSQIGSGNPFILGLLTAIFSSLISIYFGYVGVAYYFSLKR